MNSHECEMPRSASTRNVAASDAWLLQRAAEFLVGLHARGHVELPCPVSVLQHEFRLGHEQARALADALIRRGYWTFESAADGSRRAILHPHRSTTAMEAGTMRKSASGHRVDTRAPEIDRI